MMSGNLLLRLKIRDYECHALCDLGASVSTIPKTLCDVLGFRELDDCSLNLHLAGSTIKKPMGRVNDVLIVANRNYVPIDFIVLDMIGIQDGYNKNFHIERIEYYEKCWGT